MPTVFAITGEMDSWIPMMMAFAITGAKAAVRAMAAEMARATAAEMARATAAEMARATVMAAETAMVMARVAAITRAETDEKSKDLHLEVLFNIAFPGPGR